MPDLHTHGEMIHTDESGVFAGFGGATAWPATALTGWPGAPATVIVIPLVTSGYSECPPVVQLVQLWDQATGSRLTDVSATSLRIAFRPADAIKAVPSATTALNDLAQWTDLPSERLGYVVGASRRSIYNWRHGSTVPGDVTARILKAHGTLGPLAMRRAPAMLRAWLDEGTPSPAELMHTQKWDDLGRMVAHEITALVAQPAVRPPVDEDETEPLGLDETARTAILARFQTPALLGPRRPHWRPAELTGLDEAETDEEE